MRYSCTQISSNVLKTKIDYLLPIYGMSIQFSLSCDLSRSYVNLSKYCTDCCRILWFNLQILFHLTYNLLFELVTQWNSSMSEKYKMICEMKRMLGINGAGSITDSIVSHLCFWKILWQIQAGYVCSYPW